MTGPGVFRLNPQGREERLAPLLAASLKRLLRAVRKRMAESGWYRVFNAPDRQGQRRFLFCNHIRKEERYEVRFYSH